MARQSDAERGQTELRGDVQENDGKGDGDADLPLDDLVQVGVARVVVAVRVAAVAVDVEHLRMEVPEAENGRLAVRAAPLHASGQIVEVVERPLQVEPRVILERDEQRAAGEVVVRDVARRVLAELPACLGGMNEHCW
jgi:hypothetical protein